MTMCDKCHRKITYDALKNNRYSTFLLRRSYTVNDEYYILCGECSEEVGRFIEGEKNKPTRMC